MMRAVHRRTPGDFGRRFRAAVSGGGFGRRLRAAASGGAFDG
jgi:hypothetical protein